MGHGRIEEFMQSSEALPGKNVLAGNPVKTLLQEQQQARLALITRSKVRSSAFRRSGAMALPVPVKHRLAKPRSRGYYCFVASRVGDASIQRQEVVRRKSVQPERGRNKIIQQHHVLLRKIQRRRKRRGLYQPRQIECIQAPLYDGARNAKSRRPNAIAGGSLPSQILAEMLQHLFETPIIRGRIALPRNQ